MRYCTVQDKILFIIGLYPGRYFPTHLKMFDQKISQEEQSEKTKNQFLEQR